MYKSPNETLQGKTLQRVWWTYEKENQKETEDFTKSECVTQEDCPVPMFVSQI